MKISQPEEVVWYYQQKKVAEDYLPQRFNEPLNQIEHQQQVKIINKIIKEKNLPKILEFAPGPARVTAELEIENGTSLDSSRSMIALAEERMKQKGKTWSFLQADLLQVPLKLKRKVDLVFCFRFLLHFQTQDRKKIYHQAARALNDNGYLVFEAMNKKVVRPLRKVLGEKKYFVYDQLYTSKELVQELQAQGFSVLKLYPVLSHFWLQALLSRPFKLLGMKKTARRLILLLEKFPSSQPYEWVVLCQKNSEKFLK